jgi:hypothetical protein
VLLICRLSLPIDVELKAWFTFGYGSDCMSAIAVCMFLYHANE